MWGRPGADPGRTLQSKCTVIAHGFCRCYLCQGSSIFCNEGFIGVRRRGGDGSIHQVLVQLGDPGRQTWRYRSIVFPPNPSPPFLSLFSLPGCSPLTLGPHAGLSGWNPAVVCSIRPSIPLSHSLCWLHPMGGEGLYLPGSQTKMIGR